MQQHPESPVCNNKLMLFQVYFKESGQKLFGFYMGRRRAPKMILKIEFLVFQSIIFHANFQNSDSDFDKLIFFNKSLLIILEPWSVVFLIRKCLAIDQLVMQYWAM